MTTLPQVVGPKSLQKTLSTTFFLYFSIILPAIAFGNLQDDNTGGAINVEKILIGQVTDITLVTSLGMADIPKIVLVD